MECGKKNGTDEPVCRAAAETQTERENRLEDTAGRERRDWDKLSVSVETNVLPYAK